MNETLLYNDDFAKCENLKAAHRFALEYVTARNARAENVNLETMGNNYMEAIDYYASHLAFVYSNPKNFTPDSDRE